MTQETTLSSNQIKRAFAKIKQDMNELSSRIESLETENIELKNKLNSINTNNQTNSKPITLIGNVLSGKIHMPDCPYAQKIAIQNIEEFEDIKLALRQKYKKCSCISNLR